MKFADYFNVSLDYIVRGVDFKDPNVDNSLEISNAREQKCLKKFRKLTPDLQDRLLIYADGMIAAMPDDECGEKDCQYKRLYRKKEFSWYSTEANIS